ncbi:hypothetical protein [Streptomyces sp. NPDC089919]|uniref:hypothetical protein n=1 Tax=Streptomyces sp. NPDC089919 TaxID=3155188 RepID=UPI00341CCC57
MIYTRWKQAARLWVPAVTAAAAVLLAGSGAPAAPTVAQGPLAQRATGPRDRVEAFLVAYSTTWWSANGPRSRRARSYLTPSLIRRLETWSQANWADPVYQAQDRPRSWAVRLTGRRDGRASVVVTQHWGGSADTKIRYTLRLSDLMIVDLAGQPH